MLTNIFLALVVVVGFIVVFVLTRPAEFRITRSILMSVPPASPFAQVNDFHKWDAWSPWAKLDLNMKQSYEGAAVGPGAVYSWQGNREVGEGRMTILESREPELITIKLEFFKPFKATNTAVFLFESKDGGSRVTWTMEGRNNFFLRLMGIFMSMDKMLGPFFEKGLAAMKSAAESQEN